MMCIASLIFSFAYITAQEKSDAEIKQDFEAQVKSIVKSAQTMTTADDLAKVNESLVKLERDFKSHKAFLDKALYPDNFEKNLGKISEQIQDIAIKVNLISDQGVRIAELETQVKMLSEQVEKLSGENASLLAQVQTLSVLAKESKEKLDSLTQLIAKLRSNLNERDKMIFALVDSMFLQYDKSPAPIGDVGKQRVAAFERNNVLTNIKRSIVDNVKFLETTALSGEDIARVTAEQKKFASQWKGLGPKLANIYLSSKEKAKEVPTIDTMVTEWGKRVDAIFWKTLNEVFTKRNLTVKPFNSGEEFFNNIVSFIDDETNNVNKQSDETRHKAFALFVEDAWTKEISPVWIPNMKEAGIITEAQAAELAQRIATWQSKTQSSNMLLYIIGIVVLVALVLLYLKMKKAKPTP